MDRALEAVHSGISPDHLVIGAGSICLYAGEGFIHARDRALPRIGIRLRFGDRGQQGPLREHLLLPLLKAGIGNERAPVIDDRCS